MNSDSKVGNVSDEKDVQTFWMFNSPERQTPMFGDDNANVGTTPPINFDSLETRAWKLPNV